MNKKRLLTILFTIILSIIIITIFYNPIKKIESHNIVNDIIPKIEAVVSMEEANWPQNTKGSPQGYWFANGKTFTTNELLNELEVGKNWGAIENITEEDYKRINDLKQYMGYGEHLYNYVGGKKTCYYTNASKKVKSVKTESKIRPYYHQGLFGEEEWGDVISGTNLSNPNNNSTFNKNGCHIYTLAYALSYTNHKIINPPEALVLGWYSGFWGDGMGKSEQVANLNTYLGINAVTVSDDKENAKNEIDNILNKNGVVIVYVGKPFSIGDYHWICITDKVMDNGVAKYKIWTSTNIHQMFQLYTFDYLYSKRVIEDWVRVGILPGGNFKAKNTLDSLDLINNAP